MDTSISTQAYMPCNNVYDFLQRCVVSRALTGKLAFEVIDGNITSTFTTQTDPTRMLNIASMTFVRDNQEAELDCIRLDKHLLETAKSKLLKQKVIVISKSEDGSCNEIRTLYKDPKDVLFSDTTAGLCYKTVRTTAFVWTVRLSMPLELAAFNLMSMSKLLTDLAADGDLELYSTVVERSAI